MKILSAAQIRAADAFTVSNEPVSSLDLMERAAAACTLWLIRTFTPRTPFFIICGAGNNGGDGLAIARQLRDDGYRVSVCVIMHGDKLSPDNAANRARLDDVVEVHALPELPVPAPGSVIVDALLGTGLSRPVEGWLASVLHRINDLSAQHPVVSIDMPSGLMADAATGHAPCVHARYTLSFECYKLAFLLPENAERCGEVHILPIGLHPAYMAAVQTPWHLSDAALAATVYRPRAAFSHKGTYGHALLIAGSYGKIGAAVLAAQGCLRAGVGLLTLHVPSCGYDVVQTAVPEAMCQPDDDQRVNAHFHEPFRQHTAPEYATVGIGPGIGTAVATAGALEKLLLAYRKPMVFDADALNIFSRYPALLDKLPEGSILTPHPKEFERMFGATDDHFARLALLREKAAAHRVYILLKGRFSAMAGPDGAVYFNASGNPGMATGGTGDVLTGILTGLLAQGYGSKEALILGAWLHGRAGDLAAAALSQESLIAGDIPLYLGKAFSEIGK
ncbi:NAD(P)H-hydrate dehydratase [Chitinophaga lutea]